VKAMALKKGRKSKGDNIIFWKCTKCGYIYQCQKTPESCIICDSGKNQFKKIDSKQFEKIEDLIPDRKRKYRRIFKKGFTRKYKKFQK
jgi:rubredoxin